MIRFEASQGTVQSSLASGELMELLPACGPSPQTLGAFTSQPWEGLSRNIFPQTQCCHPSHPKSNINALFCHYFQKSLWRVCSVPGDATRTGHKETKEAVLQWRDTGEQRTPKGESGRGCSQVLRGAGTSCGPEVSKDGWVHTTCRWSILM